MKKYLIIALALIIPAMAYAAENLRQHGHGGALWVQNKDGTTHPAGGVLTTNITDVSTAVTKYIRAHKSGNIMKVYSILQAALTVADASVTIWSNNSQVKGGQLFGNTGHSLTVAFSGSAVGDIDSSVLTSATTATRVSQGDVIAIVSAGGSGGGAGGLDFTIVIE